MKREVLFLSFCHLLIGFITLGVGVAWIALHFFHDKFKDERLPYFAFLAMLPEIVCGFMIFICGCIGLGVKRKSSWASVFFLTCNIFNVLVWTPVLAIGYSFLVITMNEKSYCGVGLCLPADWEKYNLQYLLPEGQSWGYAFPGVGLTAGFLDFIMSVGVLFTYCCSPSKKAIATRFVTDITSKSSTSPEYTSSQKDSNKVKTPTHEVSNMEQTPSPGVSNSEQYSSIAEETSNGEPSLALGDGSDRSSNSPVLEGNDGKASSLSEPPEFKKSKGSQKYSTPKRVVPNTFISLPITNSTIKQKMADIQQQMLDEDDSIEALRISPDTFHFTMMVMKLDEKTQLKEAEEALKESVEVIRPLFLPSMFELDKISSFGQNVVYVTMSNEKSVADFKAAAAKVRQIFTEHGLPSTDNREAVPHVTLFKVDGRGGKGHKPKRLPRKLYEQIEDTYCGIETFDTLQLCSMNKKKQPNGYYHVIHEVPFNPSASSDSGSGLDEG